MVVVPSGGRSGSTDGRIVRGERTRQRLAEAVITLLEAGDPAPTARAVAAEAGVSLRLVFHHFKDMDAVYDEVVNLQIRRHWTSMQPPNPKLALAERITRTVRARARLYEAVTPVRRGTFTMAAGSESVAVHLKRANDYTRSLLEQTFAPELAAAGHDAKDLLEALDAAASWEAWERLRAVQQLGPTSARRVMKNTMTALIDSTAP